MRRTASGQRRDTRPCRCLLHPRLNSDGQAVVEYTVALTLLIAVTVGIGVFVRSSAQSASGGLMRQTFIRAPYTLSSSVGSSGQGVKDVLLH